MCASSHSYLANRPASEIAHGPKYAELLPMVRTRFAPRTTVIHLNMEMDIRWSPHVVMNLGPPIFPLPYSVMLSGAQACLPCEPNEGTPKLTFRIETLKSTLDVKPNAFFL